MAFWVVFFLSLSIIIFASHLSLCVFLSVSAGRLCLLTGHEQFLVPSQHSRGGKKQPWSHTHTHTDTHMHSLTNRLTQVKSKAYRLYTHIRSHAAKQSPQTCGLSGHINYRSSGGPPLPATSTVGPDIFNKPVTARTPWLNPELMRRERTRHTCAHGSRRFTAWAAEAKWCDAPPPHSRRSSKCPILQNGKRGSGCNLSLLTLSPPLFIMIRSRALKSGRAWRLDCSDSERNLLLYCSFVRTNVNVAFALPLWFHCHCSLPQRVR